MVQVYDNNGNEVILGRELGRGGEGAVFEIPASSKVAKLYLQEVSTEKAEKLSFMASASCTELLNFTAWPTGILRNKKGAVVGFTMPLVPKNSKEIHRLYSPKSRLSDFPKASFPFLLRVGSNTARAFASVHSKSHVIGDVNHGNVLVSQNATVTLIDCDSYQITVSGKNFLCGVGVPTYTPPELQEKSFAGVVRSVNHDCFGLAVLIFHLLFMGRHPFAGRFLGPGDMSIEQAIQEHRFAFSSQQQRTRMIPPPNTLELNEITGPVASLFETAFFDTSGMRPPATAWVSALDVLEKSIRQCSANSGHFFPSQLKSCPWCRIEIATGISLFAVSLTITPGIAGFDLDLIWNRIIAVQSPGPRREVPEPGKLKIKRSPEAALIRNQRLFRTSFGILLLILSIIVVTTAEPPGVIALLILFGGILGCATLIRQSVASGAELNAKRTAAMREYQALVAKWTQDGGDARFSQQRAELERVKLDYSSIAKERQQRLRKLADEKYQRQLKRYLESHRIDSASISGIGAGRKGVLASFGIEDADDVSERSLANVPGFGPVYKAKLLTWRRTIEQGFVFNPNEASDPRDVQAIEQDIAGKKATLERKLALGPNELARIAQETVSFRSALLPQLNETARTVAQARVDASFW